MIDAQREQGNMDDLKIAPEKPAEIVEAWKVDLETFIHFMHRLVDFSKTDHAINKRGPPQLQD